MQEFQPERQQHESAQSNESLPPSNQGYSPPHIRAGVHISPETLISNPQSPSEELSKLVTEALSLDIGTGTWQEIDTALQEGYFGPFKDQLRAEITAKHPTPAEGAVVEAFRKAGYIDAIHAPFGHYENGLLLGATAGAVISRLAYLDKEHTERPVTFDNLFLLGSSRPLFDSEFTTLKELVGAKELKKINPKTESDMMKMLWDNADIFKSFREMLNPIFVNSSRADGKNPNTEDTVVALIDVAKEAGIKLQGQTMLIQSSNPFVGFQTKAVLNVLIEQGEKPLIAHGIGYAASPKQQSVYNLGNNLAKDVNQALRLERNHAAQT